MITTIYRGIYAGQHEVKVHIDDNDRIEDILTCFDHKPNEDEMNKRALDIQKLLSLTPAIHEIIHVNSYNPLAINQLMLNKDISVSTTWEQVIKGELFAKDVKIGGTK